MATAAPANGAPIYQDGSTLAAGPHQQATPDVEEGFLAAHAHDRPNNCEAAAPQDTPTTKEIMSDPRVQKMRLEGHDGHLPPNKSRSFDDGPKKQQGQGQGQGQHQLSLVQALNLRCSSTFDNNGRDRPDVLSPDKASPRDKQLSHMSGYTVDMEASSLEGGSSREGRTWRDEEVGGLGGFVKDDGRAQDDDPRDKPGSLLSMGALSEDGAAGDDFDANPPVPPAERPPPPKRPSRRWSVFSRVASTFNGRALNQRSRSEYAFAVCAGLCLSFNSGYINGACMSGLLSQEHVLRQAVSAFTGTYTRSALVLANGETAYFGFEISMILCFIGGAFISALINPKAVPYQLGPTYGPTFLVGSAFLIMSSVMASIDPDNRSLFYFAAAANGIQNGMTSMYSGNLIRTTHLTGTSTDIGLFLGQMLRGNRANSWKFWILLGLAVSFWLGSLVSFYATTALRGFSLLLNAIFFFLIGSGCIAFIVLTNHVTVWQAVSGTWQWKKALYQLSSMAILVDGQTGKEVSKEFLLDLFDRIDTDRSDTIEEEELYGALKAAGMHVTRKGVRAMVRVADDDNDGVISRQEWHDLVLG